LGPLFDKPPESGELPGSVKTQYQTFDSCSYFSVFSELLLLVPFLFSCFFFGDHFQQKLGVELDLGDRVRCAEGSLCASSMVLSPAVSWQEITSEQLLQKVIEKRLQELLGTLLSKCGFD
jgi:hypothetical protein